MRSILAFTLIFLTPSLFAAECDPALNNLVKILSEKGELEPTANLYDKKLDKEIFFDSCDTTYQGKQYELFLHSDEITIVISYTESGVVKLKGPFYSAYSK
ncbi:hypothetical protein [Thalassotalea sp. PS06]|uniref:hypothetical protein n=1 Tax=Thalassotalea sp. PS06 TaxID=2594005 RepID=UPI001165515A|nr:hypothetical protein [Thalassotalea sp. PS06]QDP00664.1 hypothetical protein FNC98_04425 [Thalassotalea sp. PS06]